MTDIVDRLRAAALGVADAYARSLIRVGADEIERLRAERDALRADNERAREAISKLMDELQRYDDAIADDVAITTPPRDYESMSPLECYEAGLLDGGTAVRASIKATREQSK